MNSKVTKYEDYLKVVELFTSTDNNLASVIAEKLNLNTKYVDYLIDIHLSLKRNYMGGAINPPQSAWNRKTGKRIRVTENGKEIGLYYSKKECTKALNVEVNYNTSMGKKFTVNHIKLGRKLTYEYID